MAKGYSFHKTDAEFNAWLSNFAYKITEYTNIMGIDDANVTYVADAALITNYLLTLERIVNANSNEWKKLRNKIAYGKAIDPVSELPPKIDLGTPPTVPDKPIKPYLAKLIEIIKSHPNYTKYIGQDLDIV